MTTGAIELELEPRDLFGKKVRRLRRVGIIPVHMYGPGFDSRALQCEAHRLIQVLSAAGGSTPISVTVQGESGTQLAFAREIQWHPKRDDIVHVDLLVADTSRPVSAQVAIVFSGDSPGARSVSGTVMQTLRFLDVQALPLEMPNQIDIDLETLTEPDGVIRAGDIELPSNITRLTDADELVARIELPRVEVVGEAEEAQAVEGQEPGEPEAPAEEGSR